MKLCCELKARLRIFPQYFDPFLSRSDGGSTVLSIELKSCPKFLSCSCFFVWYVSTHANAIEFCGTVWHDNAGYTRGAKFPKTHTVLDFDNIFIYAGVHAIDSWPGREYRCITFTCAHNVDHHSFFRPSNRHLLVLPESVNQTVQRRHLCDIQSRKKSRTKVPFWAWRKSKRAREGDVWIGTGKYGEYESHKRMNKD